eukprot:8411218-Pyramimonas_sp.AAC.1
MCIISRPLCSRLLVYCVTSRCSVCEPCRRWCAMPSSTATCACVSIQARVKEHSGNIQGTFREHSRNIPGTFQARVKTKPTL